MTDDAFDCFGSDSDDDGPDHDNAPQEQVPTLRDPGNGVLAFHAGTEQALLLHVKHHLDRKWLRQASISDRIKAVVHHIDRFCLERHWMMNVGPEKGVVVEQFLEECIQSHMGAEDTKGRFSLVELGTYCGYSCLRFLLVALKHFSVEGSDFHLYTVDVSAEVIQVAKQFIELVGASAWVTFIHLSNPKAARESMGLSCDIKQEMEKHGAEKADFLFIDHDKDGYLTDLQQLESTNVIQRGTFVAADNVLFHGIDAYRRYANDLAVKGVVSTRLVEGLLEYVDERTRHQEMYLQEPKDGIDETSELTVYLRNPVSV